MLYLVPSSPKPSNPNNFSKRHADFTKEPNTPGFFYDFKEIPPRQFSFYAQDSSHGLSSSFSLEIFSPAHDSASEDEPLPPVLVCDFPTTDGSQLSKIVLGDEYLEAILMLLFHLKILKALFLFGTQQGAAGLMLCVDHNYRNWIHAYEDLIVSEDQVMTKKGKQTQIVISTDVESYDELIDLMDTMNAGFRQSLWREQRENLAIRLYLKSHALAEF